KWCRKGSHVLRVQGGQAQSFLKLLIKNIYKKSELQGIAPSDGDAGGSGSSQGGKEHHLCGRMGALSEGGFNGRRGAPRTGVTEGLKAATCRQGGPPVHEEDKEAARGWGASTV
ncbi:hypothetical protein GOP47_0002217, partial [Adiantum capillus-veneris]